MSTECHPAEPDRYLAALRRFDTENARDPNLELADGKAQPRELLYAQWLTDWVLRLCPQASEPLRLAARCQHLCRWMVPRDSQPANRAGYLKWRAGLKQFHAEKAAAILREVGYPESTVVLVQDLILKKHFPDDADARVLEDALCLIFLERQFAPLAARSADDKMINALRKSWLKMTPAAQALARQFPYGPHEKSLLDRALSPHP
jgi:hypothetical protein